MYQEIHSLNERARQLARKNLPEAIRLTEEAARLSQEAGAYGSPYIQGLAESWHQLGRFHHQLAQYDQALACFGQAQIQYEALGGGEQLAALFGIIGTTYAFMSDYADALRYELKGLEEAQRIGHRRLEATGLNNVGSVLIDIGDYAKALPYLESGLPIFRDLNDVDGQAMMLDSLAQAYLGLSDYERALTSSLESVRLCRAGGDRRREAEHLTTAGRIYAAQVQAEPAQQSFKAALELARAGGYRREEEMALRYLGSLYRQQGKLGEARACLQEALKIAVGLNTRRNQYECHETLSVIYREMRDFEKALYHYERFHTIRESVFNDDNEMKLRGLEVQHRLQTAQKESEIYQLRNVELEREVAERRRAESALKELAVTDGLTGLANRRYLLDLARAALALSQRYNRPLSLMMMDIDRFKGINDMHGHAVGDQVLTQFANRLKTTLRMADMVGRYGGDEFIVVLPETDLSQATQVAQRVRTAITGLPIQIKDFGLYINTSIGFTSNEHDYSLPLEALIEQADTALYAVKSGKQGPVYAFEPDR